MTWLTWLASFIVACGGGGGVAAVLVIPAQRRKIRSEGHLSEADAAATLSDAALKLLGPARQEVARLNARLTAAEGLVDQLTSALRSAQTEVSDLRGQVDRMSKDLGAANAEVVRLREV